MTLQAELKILHKGEVKSVTTKLEPPKRLVPIHINNRPPPYFIIAGLVFTQARAMHQGCGLFCVCTWKHALLLCSAHTCRSE